MANNMTFSIGLKTNYDASGINQLKKELQDIKKLTKDSNFNEAFSAKELIDMANAARDLEKALESAYDPHIGTVSIDRFNKSLKLSGTNLVQVHNGLKQAGAQGEKAFLGATRNMMQMNKVTKETNGLLNQMATTMANTVRWGITSALWNNITGSIQTAFYYVKDLDTALNDIRIVTGKSAEDMADFAVEANNAAKALAVTTEDYTRGALIYYQQGLDDNTVKTLTDITSMTANVTGQSMDTVSEQLTAVWNGYKVANQAAEEGIGVYEEYVDKMAAVGAATASDLEELSTAMSKVASAAASMGVGFDSLNAQIATIVSVTRQAPESVGTALKTIYARMGDLQLGKTDEDGVGLGQVSGELDKLGIAVLDAQGNMRDMEEVITEVGEAWDTWTEAERQAIAVALAGKRQYNNLIALFDNWTMYTDTLNVSLESAGTLQEQQAIATESLANKMDVLRATAEDLYDNLFNEEAMKDMIDAATKLLQVLADVVDSIGGLQTILPMIGAIGLRVFSTQIGNSIGRMVLNLQKSGAEMKAAKLTLAELESQKSSLYNQKDDNPIAKKAYEELLEIQKKRVEYAKYLTEEEQKQLELYQKQIEETAGKKMAAQNITNASLPNFLVQADNIESPEGAAKIRELATAYNQATQAFGKYKFEDYNFDIEDIVTDPETNIIGKITDKLSELFKDQDYFTEDDAQEIVNTWSQEAGKDIITNLTNAIDNADIEGATSGLEEAFNSLKESMQQQSEDALEKVTLVDEANQAEVAQDLIRQTEIDTLDLNVQMQQIGETISNVVGSVGSLVTGFSMLGQLGNIWTDDNLTGWEKISQTFSNLMIALPMLITGFQGLKAIKDSEIVQTKILVPLQTLFNKEKREEIYTNQLLTMQRKLASLEQERAILLNQWENASLDALEKENVELALAENAAKIEKIQGNIATAESIIGNTAEAGSKTVNAKATGILTKAQWLLNAAWAANPIGLVVAALALLVAAIAACVVIYDKMNLSVEESNEALKEARAKYEDATTALKEYTNQIEETKDRLRELYDIAREDLTLADEEEIANLERELRLLEALAEEEKSRQEEAESKAYSTVRTAVQQDTYNTDGRGEYYNSDFYEVKKIDGIEVDGTQSLDYIYREYLKAQGYTDEVIEQLANSTVARQKFIDDLYQYTSTNLDNVDEEVNIGGLTMTRATVANIIKSHENDGGITDWGEDFSLEDLIFAADEAREEQDYATLEGVKETIAKYYTDNHMMDDMVENIFARVFESEEDMKDALSQITFDETGNINYGNLDESLIKKLNEQADLYYLTIEDIIETAFSYNLNYLTDKRIQSTEEMMDNLISYLNRNQEFKEQLYAMSETGFLNEESLSQLGEYDKLLELVGGNVEDLILVLEDLAEQSTTTFDSINDLQTMQSGFESLSDVYGQKMNGDGFVDTSNLQNLYEDFGNIEGFNDFIVVMQNVNATTEESQEAFNRLATNYLDAKYNLMDITDENRAYAEEALRRLGITNAEEIVDRKVAIAQQMRAEALADIKDANLDVTMTSEELQEASYEEIDALYLEAIEAGNTADSLRDLLLAQKEVDMYELNMASTVDEILSVAGAAAFTAEQLLNLRKIEADMAALDERYKAGQISGVAYSENMKGLEKLYDNALDEVKEGYEAEKDEASAKTEYEPVQAKFSGIQDDKGSSSSKSTKDQKDFDDEYDRYWEFNKLIEKVTDTIEDLDEAQENLHGRELISALENENRLLDKQAEAYEKLYAEQKREQAELQSSLGSLGLQFDADGAITNYAAQTSQMLSDYNKAVAEYNAGMMNEETFAIYEQNYEKFKTGLARYEELYYSEMKDAQDKLEEIRKQQRANNLEAWEIDIELKLETSEFERDVANFLHDIEDDFKKVYEDLGDDFENIFANMGTYDADVSTTLQAIKDVTAEIDKMQNGGESDMFESISQAQEKLKDLNKDLQDSASSMHDLWVDAWDTYIEGIDQSAEKFDDLNEKYDRIGQEIEFQGDLIKLLYGDEAYDLMADYFDAQKTNTLAQVDSFRQQRDMWKQMYESAEDGSEDQQKYYELMNEAQDNLNGSVKEYIELLQNEATNAIDGALKKYENLITNGQGLDVVNEQWERTKDYADAVFDSVEKTYHVQDLASKIKQSINDAEGLKSQQKLQELYDKEINYLLDKKELTQYDIDAANARYQIALKEIALEEAQNAKNSMKVVRGADGNWDYQYVADDENVEEKKRELSDSIYALYELANNSYMESMDNLLEIEQKYQEQAKALAEEAVQTGADVSERKRALDEWYESEKTRISEQGALARQDMLTSSVGVLKDAYDNNVINYENMTNSQIALIEGVSQAGVDSFADLEVKVNDNFQNIGDMARQVIAETVPEWNSAAWDIAEQWIGDDGSIKQAFEETGATLTQITEDYRTDVDELGEVADMNLGEDGIAGALQDNIELTEELEGATENLVDTSVDALEEYQDALSAVEDAWYAVKDSITSAIDEIREYLALAGQASNVDVSISNPTAGRGNSWDFGTGDVGDGGKGNERIDPSGNQTPEKKTAYLEANNFSGGQVVWSTILPDGSRITKSFAPEVTREEVKKAFQKDYEDVVFLDTGGYTGEWGGGEGRMAMLHSKELVLNAKDTENILDAVSAVRSFASIGNSINEAIMSGIAKMLLSASGKVLGSVSKVDNSSNDNSQNIFHINAEFPNANDMAEIQAAILSLPRIASQQTEIIVK